MANVGLTALDFWWRVKPDELKSFFPRILPLLNDYLLIRIQAKDVAAEGDENVVRICQAIDVKSGLESTPSHPIQEKEANLKQVQQERIARLLGKFGGHNIHILQEVNLAESNSEASVAWDSSNHVMFNFPFVDVKVALYLDKFLPRIVTLAESMTHSLFPLTLPTQARLTARPRLPPVSCSTPSPST